MQTTTTGRTIRQADIDHDNAMKQLHRYIKSAEEKHAAIAVSLNDTDYDKWLKSFDKHWTPPALLPFRKEPRFRLVGEHLVFQQGGYYVGHIITKKAFKMSSARLDMACHPAKQQFPTINNYKNETIYPL